MTGNNEWASLAAEWLDNRDAAKAFKDSEKSLKGLVTDDVGRAFGHGVQVKRDKRGALRISEEK